jgi:hypothetical protein
MFFVFNNQNCTLRYTDFGIPSRLKYPRQAGTRCTPKCTHFGKYNCSINHTSQCTPCEYSCKTLPRCYMCTYYTRCCSCLCSTKIWARLLFHCSYLCTVPCILCMLKYQVLAHTGYSQCSMSFNRCSYNCQDMIPYS